MPEGLILALLLSTPGAPPGLGMAEGNWPNEWPGRHAPASFRARIEPALERQLAHDERGCFIYALEDLDGDGQDEALAFVETFGQCGSAGCPVLVLRRSGRRLEVLARLSLVRNVYLTPRTRPGLRPLFLEKWQRTLFRAEAANGRYPNLPWRPSRALRAIPPGLREVSWIRAERCDREAGVPVGLRRR